MAVKRESYSHIYCIMYHMFLNPFFVATGGVLLAIIQCNTIPEHKAKQSKTKNDITLIVNDHNNCKQASEDNVKVQHLQPLPKTMDK